MNTPSKLRVIRAMIASNTKPGITRNRRRTKRVTGFAVLGPDQKLYVAGTFNEAVMNLAVRVRCWRPSPRWEIKPYIERKTP